VFVVALGAMIFMVIALGLNIAIVVGYHGLNSQTTSIQSNEAISTNNTIQRRLTGYAIYTFFGHLIWAIYMVRKESLTILGGC
jgi:hypothetical protein